MVLTNAPWNNVWSYLTNHLQKTKIDTVYSTWTKILKEVPEWLVLGPILLTFT